MMAITGLTVPMSCRHCGEDLVHVEPRGGTGGIVERALVVCTVCERKFVITVTMRRASGRDFGSDD